MNKPLLLVCPLLLLSSAVWGASVCTNTTLNVYTNNDMGGFSCTIGGLTFSNFQYTSPSGLPTEATVEVTPTNDGTNIGFFFTGAFTAAAGMSADAVLSYLISSGASAGITGAAVALTSYGASGAGASASIVEGVCTTMPQGDGSCVPASDAYSLSVFDNADHPPAKQADAVTFTSATSTVFVTKNIVEVGGNGSATISQFENTVQVGGGGPGGGPVPEPASLFTMGSGLIATCMLLRKKLKKS
jgi:hypothetical protein